MSEEEKQFGMNWIITTLRSFSDESDIQIEDMEWVSYDFDRGSHSLLIRANGKQEVEKFSHEDLTDCQNDKNVRLEIEGRLKKLIKSIVSRKNRIGF